MGANLRHCPPNFGSEFQIFRFISSRTDSRDCVANYTIFAKDFDINKLFCRIFVRFLPFYLHNPTKILQKKVYSYRNPWQKLQYCQYCTPKIVQASLMIFMFGSNAQLSARGGRREFICKLDNQERGLSDIRHLILKNVP